MKSIYPAFPFPVAKPPALPCTTGWAGLLRPAALPTEALDTAVYQHLQELLAQMPVAMYLLRGPAHVLDLVNVLAAASWGYAVDQVRGRPFFEALPHLRDQGYEAACATVWQTQQVVTWQEAPITNSRQPDGKTVTGYFDVSFQPFYEGPGRLAGILVTSQDVTAQVLARQRVQQATEELAATNAGLADYVTELTHVAHAAQGHAELQATLLTQLLERVPLAIGLLVGPEYVVQVCNPALLARWECPLAQVLHQPLFEALPALQYQGLRGLLDEVGRTGVPAAAPQLPGQSGLAFSYYPLQGAQGQTVAIAAVATAGGPACLPQSLG